MPTPSGGETIGERLTRLRADRVRLRATIERMESNGASVSINGDGTTEIQYDRAVARLDRVEADISTLEARLAGTASARRIAHVHTRMP